MTGVWNRKQAIFHIRSNHTAGCSSKICPCPSLSNTTYSSSKLTLVDLTGHRPRRRRLLLVWRGSVSTLLSVNPAFKCDLHLCRGNHYDCSYSVHAIRTTQITHLTQTPGCKPSSANTTVGRILNNQARVLEARATRTGIPQGPGASVLPPKSYFDNLPPDLDVDGPGKRLRASVASGASDASTATTDSAVSTGMGTGSARTQRGMRAGQEVQGPSHSGDAKRLEGRGAGGPVLH
jgi:hypothetical protein